MLPDTKRPQRESILIGEVTFRLDEEARSGSGSGVLLSGGASFSHPIAPRLQSVVATSVAAKTYARSRRTKSGNPAGKLDLDEPTRTEPTNPTET